jgi:chemotaxis-related protein WspB
VHAFAHGPFDRGDGQVAPDAHGMLQLLDPARLLAPDVEALLFGEGT